MLSWAFGLTLWALFALMLALALAPRFNHDAPTENEDES